MTLFHDFENKSADSSSPIWVISDCRFPNLALNNLDAASMHHQINGIKKDMEMMKKEKEEHNEVLNDLKAVIFQLTDSLKTKATFADVVAEAGSSMSNGCKSSSSSADTNSQSLVKSSKFANTNKYTGNTSNLDLPEQSRCWAAAGQISQNNDGVWKEVGPSKKKFINIGKLSTNDCNVKAIKRPVSLFVTRFLPSTSSDEVKRFVKDQYPNATDVTCSKLKTKYDSYSSFKIDLMGDSFQDAINMNNWPVGILVKKFYNQSRSETGRPKNSDSRSEDSTNHING